VVIVDTNSRKIISVMQRMRTTRKCQNWSLILKIVCDDRTLLCLTHSPTLSAQGNGLCSQLNSPEWFAAMIMDHWL